MPREYQPHLRISNVPRSNINTNPTHIVTTSNPQGTSTTSNPTTRPPKNNQQSPNTLEAVTPSIPSTSFNEFQASKQFHHNPTQHPRSAPTVSKLHRPPFETAIASEFAEREKERKSADRS
ncbi:hypothetical protein EKO04_007342 [Ascochyta lentis]|uniref:Uncharacterized protein n=1 Tax=Ascochyta lentis TaxID=205686 RepID=A0A8H7MFE7_9PLEO|nr:hypothetical protein EKO04_007342 [Ascochyta lentis]